MVQMLRRIEFGFGVGFDKDNNAIDSSTADAAARSVLIEVALQFGGGNLVHGHGSWDSGKGVIVERSCTLTADIPNTLPMFEAREKIAIVVARIKQVLNQAAVHVVCVHHADGAAENI
jgi:hypothetical protein